MFGPVEQGDWLHACGIRERYFLYDFCEEIVIFNPPGYYEGVSWI